MMNNVLEITITLDIVDLPSGTANNTSAIAKALDVPTFAVLDVTVFRWEFGFVAIVKPAERRINFATVFKELEGSWSVFPTKEELRKVGVADYANPFTLASDSRVKIVIDAWALVQEPKALIIPIGNDRVIRTCVTDLMVGTKAKVLGGITVD